MPKIPIAKFYWIQLKEAIPEIVKTEKQMVRELQ
jgi:hypothetical protein